MRGKEAERKREKIPHDNPLEWATIKNEVIRYQFDAILAHLLTIRRHLIIPDFMQGKDAGYK